jgi:quercetin dioxygenase-like cupin family protein
MTNAPTVTIGAVKNVFVRVMQFENSGCEELSHGHQFDHATLVASGAVKVTANGKETIFKAPHLIWIKKDVIHKLEAIEPNTVCACIHGLRDETGDIVDPDMIPEGVQFDGAPPTRSTP